MERSLLFEGRKEHSYLFWTILIDGELSPYHLTAKYFGQLNMIAGDILDRLDTCSDFPHHEKLAWDLRYLGMQPTLFIHDGLARLKQVHDLFDEIRKDDYPEYIPHVSIPHAYFEHLATGLVQGREPKIEIGHLFLKMKSDHLFSFTPKTS